MQRNKLEWLLSLNHIITVETKKKLHMSHAASQQVGSTSIFGKGKHLRFPIFNQKFTEFIQLVDKK